jgi:hypothetical protein
MILQALTIIHTLISLIAKLIVYKGVPYGMPSTLKDEINANLLAFIKV